MQETVGQKSPKEAEWQERLARFIASGQQVREFCRAERVSAATFYRWREQLCGPVEATTPAASFIDAGVLPPVVRSDSASAVLEVRLDLGNGLVLHIVRR